ncbi:MAG: bifunctional nuclease family protein [Schleiferiaceae bacterium]|nr:bifunctional nuclease family protein [Schleiferiaceae bacterium]MDG1881019.1 bifunctional nuclease family protein [Schleiferiaceae bacterium]
MDDKIRVEVKGLTYSERPSGAYALLLESVNEKIKIPIVIGAFEAQSIAIALDKMTKPPRPMTHDLFQSMLEKHEINLKEVLIKDLQDGVFYAELVFKSSDTEHQIDSRPSDAIALALRSKCPIYTTKEVLIKAGMASSVKKPEHSLSKNPLISNQKKLDDLNSISKENLEELLNKAILSEDYELAARIRDTLNNK